MADNVRLDLDEDERLPWLEPAQEDEGEEGVSPVRLLGLVLLGLVLLGLVLAGIWWVRNFQAGDGGEGVRIAAPEGDYKVRPGPGDADARAFEGTGDASFAASEGAEPVGTIDGRRMPEAPVAAVPTASPRSIPAPASKVTAKVADSTRAADAGADVAPKKGPSSVVQLGAYGSTAIAKESWTKLAKRFPYLEPLTMSVEPVEVGKSTLYRLRALAASPADAGRICGKLKVAGENCIIVR